MVLTQAVRTIDITGLDIKEGETIALRIYTPTWGESEAYFYLRVNGITTGYYSSGLLNTTYIRRLFREFETTSDIHISLLNGNVIFSANGFSVGGTTFYNNPFSGLLKGSLTSITSIWLDVSNLGIFPIGSSIRIVRL